MRLAVGTLCYSIRYPPTPGGFPSLRQRELCSHAGLVPRFPWAHIVRGAAQTRITFRRRCQTLFQKGCDKHRQPPRLTPGALVLCLTWYFRIQGCR